MRARAVRAPRAPSPKQPPFAFASLGGSARSWWREKEKFLFSWSLPGEKWGEGKQAATSKGGNASEKGEERNRRGGSGRSRKQVVKVTAVGPEKEGGGGGGKCFSFRLLACSHYFILVTVAAATPPSSKSPDSTLPKNGAIPPLRRRDSSIDLRGERGTR